MVPEAGSQMLTPRVGGPFADAPRGPRTLYIFKKKKKTINTPLEYILFPKKVLKHIFKF